MKYSIVELDEFSGEMCKIYSLMEEGGEATLFDHFYDEWHKVLPDEVDNIAFRMYAIGNRFGAREQYFRMFEGKPGDGVCALFDVPNSKLRLYGIRFGNIALILGGGAEKPKNIRSWQEDQNLSKHATIMLDASKAISDKIRNKEIILNDNCFKGDLTIDL